MGYCKDCGWCQISTEKAFGDDAFFTSFIKVHYYYCTNPKVAIASGQGHTASYIQVDKKNSCNLFESRLSGKDIGFH